MILDQIISQYWRITTIIHKIRRIIIEVAFVVVEDDDDIRTVDEDIEVVVELLKNEIA